MKLKKALMSLVAPFLLVSCGGNSSEAPSSPTPSTSSPADSSPIASLPTESSVASQEPTPSLPATSSVEAPFVTSEEASKGSKGVSSEGPVIPSTPASTEEGSNVNPSSSEVTSSEQDKDKDYIIFSRAPEIHFSTEEGADLKWATEPNKNTQNKPKVTGTISTTNCPEEYALADAAATMKVRGNYTSNYQKKPFQINFDTATNLFGLNESREYKKWVLLADVKDSSLMRNALAFYLGGRLLDEYFCPSFTPVHFYINDNYWGMYLLADQKEVGEGRVEIHEPGKKETGTGIGYFFEYDCYWQEEAAKEDGDPTFAWNDSDYIPRKITARDSAEESAATGYTISSKIRDIDAETKQSAAQVPFLKNHLKNCYTVIYNAVFEDKLQEIQTVDGVESLVDSSLTDMEQVLAKTIDVNSFVNMYILNEICCDADVGHSSFYLSLDMSETGNKLLTLTCPWDWDSSLGLKNRVVENAEAMFASHCSNPWVSMLTNTEWFMKKVQTRWQTLLNDGFFAGALDMIDDYAARYAADYKQNFDRWPGTMGRNNEVVNEVRSIYYSCTTEAEAEALLADWVATRFAYLTNAFDGSVPENNTGSGGGGSKGGQGQGGQGGQTVVEDGTEKANAFKEGKTPVVYEAEEATISNGEVSVKNPSIEGEVVSNNTYIGNLNTSGIGIEFAVKNAKEGEALISLRLPRRQSTYTLSQLFTLSINGVNATSDELLNISLTGATPPTGYNEYHNWTEWDIAITNLNEGDNTIKLTTQANATNLDCLYLYQA